MTAMYQGLKQTLAVYENERAALREENKRLGKRTKCLEYTDELIVALITAEIEAAS